MKKLSLFPGLILFALSSLISSNAVADQKSDLDPYFKIFNKETIPTLENYSRFHTDEDEVFQETLLEEVECRRMGLKPSEKYDPKNDCTEFMIKRSKNASKEPSFYLTWLRTKLPLSPQIKIVKVKTIR